MWSLKILYRYRKVENKFIQWSLLMLIARGLVKLKFFIKK